MTVDEKMKLRLVTFLIIVGVGVISWYFLNSKSPSIPRSSKTVMISLREPYKGGLIVEKTISDPSVIAAVAESFSRAKPSSDHKCASIGTISFHSESGTTTLEVLPGHDTGRYEFRLDGEMYSLPRSSYIDSLVAVGIDLNDIRLDGHPDIEQDEDIQEPAPLESKREDTFNDQPEVESAPSAAAYLQLEPAT